MGPKLRDESMIYCVVLGCKNSGHELKLWRKARCNLHTGTHNTCGCKQPFILYRFPESPKLCQLWLQRIGLPELDISDETRVCNIHFVEGKPTQRSFFPTLYLQPDLSDEEDDDDDTDIPSVQGDPLAEHDVDQQLNNSEASFPKITSTFNYTDDFEINEESEEEMELFTNTKVNVEAAELKMKSSPEKPSSRIVTNTDNNDDTNKKEHAIRIEQASSSILESSNGEQPEEITNALDNQEANEKIDDNDDEVEILFHSGPPKPLASYDPQAQTLQISNPVKYIQECHTRIAQLIAEKEQMKNELQAEIEQLKCQNEILKRRQMSARRINLVKRKRNSGQTPLVLKSKKLPQKGVTYRKKLTQ